LEKKIETLVFEFGSIYLDKKFGCKKHVVKVDKALLFKRLANVCRVLLGTTILIKGTIDRVKNSKYCILRQITWVYIKYKV
jgi:hypothetical protein